MTASDERLSSVTCNSSVNNNNSNSSDKIRPEFTAQCNSINLMINMLSAIHLKKKSEEQKAIVIITESAIKISTELYQSMGANCFLKREYFNNYFMKEPEIAIEFSIDLGVFIQVISMFSDVHSSLIFLEYRKNEQRLQIFVADNGEGCITECQMDTYEEEGVMNDFNWEASPITNQLQLKQQHLKDIFNEFDALADNNDVVVFQIKTEMKKDDQKMQTMNDQMCNESTDGELCISVKTKSLAFANTLFINPENCLFYELNVNQKYHYPMGILRPVLRAVVKSTAIRMYFNEAGILSIHYIFNEGNHNGWISFFVLPLAQAFVDDENNENFT